MFTEYLTMPEIERVYNRVPQGFRHYRSEDLYETSIIGLDLMLHKLGMIFAGGKHYEHINKDDYQETEREVLPRHMRTELY